MKQFKNKSELRYGKFYFDAQVRRNSKNQWEWKKCLGDLETGEDFETYPVAAKGLLEWGYFGKDIPQQAKAGCGSLLKTSIKGQTKKCPR